MLRCAFCDSLRTKLEHDCGPQPLDWNVSPAQSPQKLRLMMISCCSKYCDMSQLAPLSKCAAGWPHLARSSAVALAPVST
jgi:hypothetical protein